ncbi:hydrolase [Streptomyces sp. VRA16 Mangrove soil]|uniref:alpha/beta hydrolase n=1 Tax=Streptomyces sp. VRA16 Mangrove soil TaxID=2817434 RepID=UPI001A9D0FE9|nr:hydrolase [Streptomyces sp. VRA16 Mangrove soil]MBO1330638.1 hydrolase [Streptomyces sp. VRA16 Mangrove soil]
MDVHTTAPSRRAVLATGAALLALGATPGTAAALTGTRLVRPHLPAPTGPHPVGITKLHLVDHGRRDPWTDAPAREVMLDVRYPARSIGGHGRAPYMTPAEAAGFDALNNFQGLPSGRVDWAGIRTFAHTAAPLDGRAAGPVVLYSPGVLDPRCLGTTLTDELASHGYVVIAVDHPYDVSAVEFPDGRVVHSRLPQEFARAQQEGKAAVTALLKKTAAVRFADTRFVLDALPAALADLGHSCTRAGMFGQSAGGFAALQTLHDDRRLAAAANLDGVIAYVQDDHDPGELSTVAAEGVDRPFLLMGSADNDRTNVPSWRSLWRHSTGWHRDLTLHGAEHATYTDATTLLPQIAARLDLPRDTLTGWVGTVRAHRAVAAQRAYLTAFFDRWLRGRDDDGLLDRPSPRHPDITFV